MLETKEKRRNAKLACVTRWMIWRMSLLLFPYVVHLVSSFPFLPIFPFQDRTEVETYKKMANKKAEKKNVMGEVGMSPNELKNTGALKYSSVFHDGFHRWIA